MNLFTINNFHPQKTKVPFHVGLIPDGTRRWAIKNSVQLTEAYYQAMDKMEQFIIFFFYKGIKEISIYLSSMQNFRRTKSEIDSFCRAEAHFCDIALKNISKKYSSKITAIGNVDVVPVYFQNSINKIERVTTGKSLTSINLCIAYNPIEEVFQASKLANSPSEFLQHLYVKTPLDLVIRTGKANLLSNFLLLQSGFARLYFIEKLFNDTEIMDIEKIISTFKRLTRKYGE